MSGNTDMKKSNKSSSKKKRSSGGPSRFFITALAIGLLILAGFFYLYIRNMDVMIQKQPYLNEKPGQIE
jgi:hypothetical protein